MNFVKFKNNKPLVAICIPAYENIECLQRLISSVQMQTYENYIVIITDDSQTYCIEEYIKILGNDRIIYYRNPTRVGASHNTNNAIKLALKNNAEIIKLMHQDDWFTYENSLEKMIGKLIKTNSDVIFTGNFEVYSQLNRERICSKLQLEQIRKDITNIYRANVLGAPSNILYRSSGIYFDSSFTWLLDVDFYLRLLPDKTVEYIYEPLVSIGHDGNQLTDYFLLHPEVMLKETLKLYQKLQILHTWNNRFYLVHFLWKSVKQIIKKQVRKIYEE